MNKKIKKFLSLVLNFIIIFSTSVFAKDVDIKVVDAKLLDKSDGLVVSNPTFDSSNLNADVTFNEEGDFVLYELTIKNLDNEAWKINEVQDNNQNDNFEIEYSYDKDSISKNGTGKVKIKFIYKKKLVNTDSVSIDDLKISLNFINEAGEESSIIINNPTTRDGILKYLVLLIISVTSLYFIKIRKRVKRLKVGNLLLIVAIIMSPFMIFANEKFQISINIKAIILKSEMLPYQITFNTNGGNDVGTKIITYGDKIGTLPIASKEGYIFNGWKDQDGNDVTEDTVVKGKLELKANYTAIKYNITYNLNGGKVESSNKDKYTIEDEFDLVNPTRKGYTFSGWTGSNGESLQTRVTINRGETGDKEFTANWSTNEDTPYKVIHKYEKLDGTYEEVVENLKGATDTTVVAPIKHRDGFVDPKTQNIKIEALDDLPTVTYIYEREKYSFSIIDRTYIDETSDADGMYPYETEITVKAKEREGYTFKWSDDNTSLERKIKLENNKVLETIYTPKTDIPYKVIHKLMGVDGITYTIKDTDNLKGETDTQVTPSVNKYIGFTSPSTKTVKISGDGKTEIEYLYTRNKYSLVIEDTDFVEEDKSGEYYYESEVALKARDREGYTFEKWSNGKTTKEITIKIEDDITVKPIYKEIIYTVTLNSNGGELSTDSIKVKSGDSIGNLPTPTAPTGKVFDSWYTSLTDGVKVDENYKPSNDITIYARYKNETYTITFDSDGGTEVASKEINPGDSLGELEEPQKDGLVFISWALEDGEKVNKNYVPTGNITLHALFKSLLCKKATTLHTATCESTGSCYNVGYKEGGSKNTTTLVFGSLPYGTLVSGNAYDCDVNGDGTYDEENERFYYLTTTDKNNAVLISSTNYEGNAGQKTDNNFLYSVALTKLPTTSSTQWKNVEVTFKNPIDSSDDNVYAARFVTYDELKVATGKDNLTSTGSLDDYPYLFENTRFVSNTTGRTGMWVTLDTSNDKSTYYRIHAGSSNRNLTSVGVESNNVARPVIEVPIKYMEITSSSAVTHKITFESNGGTIVNPIEIEENQSIRVLPIVTRNGFEFDGWYYESNFETEVKNTDSFDKDTTIYAKWNVVAAVEMNGSYYSTITSAISSAPTSQTTINVLKNISENVNIPNTKNIILNLNGFTISNLSTAAVIENKGILKVTDGTITSTSGDNGAFNNLDSSAVLEINNVSVLSTGAKQALYNKGGMVTITGDSHFSNTSSNRAAVHNLNNGIMIIESGTIVSEKYHAVYNELGTLTIGKKDGVVDISTPVLQGEKSGLSTASMFNFYDGIIKGKTNSIDDISKLVEKEESSEVVTGTEDSYKTSYLHINSVNIKVTFDANGGSVSPEFITLEKGNKIGELPTPTKGLYTFDGWFTGIDSVEKVTETYIPDGDITLYAHYHYDSSDDIKTFDMTNDVMKVYYNNISTWKDNEDSFQENMNSNFRNYNCSECDASGDKPYQSCPTPTSGTTLCDQPNGYSTGITSDLKVYISDENTKEKGNLVTYTTSVGGVIYNMIPGKTYYWESADDSNIHGLVKTTSKRRYINSSVRNVRDLGGLKVDYNNDGVIDGTLEYGRLFRGTKLNSDADVQSLVKLGITEEVDLRGSSSDPKLSNYKARQIVNYEIDKENFLANYNSLRNTLVSTMKDIINNENIYFHCAIGTDRTGTLAYFLEGLLGVSEEDRLQDYELSYFYGLLNRHRFYNYQAGSSITHRFDYMHNLYPSNDDIYDWFMEGSTNVDDDKKLINDFRNSMINWNN